MDNTNIQIIQPLQNKPDSTERHILYPQYIAEVDIQIPRAIGRPRRFRVFLLADGCTGKVVRCDGWPLINEEKNSHETVSLKIPMENAEQNIADYALKKIARKYQSYWKPQIDIVRMNLVYKTFWMTDANCAVDSITAKKLVFS